MLTAIIENLQLDVALLYELRANGQVRFYSAAGTAWDASLSELFSEYEVSKLISKDEPLAISDIKGSPYSKDLERIGEVYRSFVSAPILRAGTNLGTVILLAKQIRAYSGDEIEVLQTAAMVLAESFLEEITNMKKLWVTYAWKDNENLDVDFILQELRKVGIDTCYDRRKLIPGQSLWDQIDQQITNPENSDAWALVVSKRSLESKPCREELSYALQRAIEKRGSAYPLIGIFVEEINSALIPSAIRTRLYVNTASPDWVERVRAGVWQEQPDIFYRDIAPYYINVRESEGTYSLVVEARPRTGTWSSCVALVPSPEKGLLFGVLVRPSGKVPRIGRMPLVEGEWRGGEFWAKGPAESAVVTPTMSMYVFLTSVPTRLLVGPTENPIEVDLSTPRR